MHHFYVDDQYEMVQQQPGPQNGQVVPKRNRRSMGPLSTIEEGAEDRMPPEELAQFLKECELDEDPNAGGAKTGCWSPTVSPNDENVPSTRRSKQSYFSPRSQHAFNSLLTMVTRSQDPEIQHLPPEPVTFAEVSSFILLFLSGALLVIALVFGSVYFYDCSIQPHVPLYLVVFGTVGLVQWLIGIGFAIYERENDVILNKSIVQGLFNLFHLIWLFYGAALVYPIFKPTTDVNAFKFCHPNVYYCAFIYVTVLIIVIPLFITAFVVGFLRNYYLDKKDENQIQK